MQELYSSWLLETDLVAQPIEFWQDRPSWLHDSLRDRLVSYWRVANRSIVGD